MTKEKDIKKLEEELKNTRENNRFLVKELSKNKTPQLEKGDQQFQTERPTIIYFCNVCQTSKNNKVDGEVYRIKISILPNVISNVCPACRPNVVMVSDDNWKDF